MKPRLYDPERDKDAVLRIFSEIGWMRDSDDQKKSFALIAEAGRCYVADLNGEAECLAANTGAVMRHAREDLPLTLVSAVATSRIARRAGFASQLTAEGIAREVIDHGSILSGLGMFDQGYYDRLGFGTGAAANYASIDPATIVVDAEPGIPERLTADDFERMHASRLARFRGHGGTSLVDPRITRAETLSGSNAFGLGFSDPASGELTHHLWLTAKSVVQGPFNVSWMSWQTGEQFRELMALLADLKDQVLLITMPEPPGIQMQDFVCRPFRRAGIGSKGNFEARTRAVAWWQMRMCDVVACLARTKLPGSDSVSFNLSLTDPISEYLTPDTRAKWSGVAGEYRVTLGPESRAVAGRTDSALPTMRTSVNTFTRLWLSVKPATGLAMTCQDLEAPEGLLRDLDDVVRLPAPQPDWPF